MTIQVVEAGIAFSTSVRFGSSSYKVQIEAVLSAYASVSKMGSSSVVGRNLRCGAPALSG